MSTHRIVIVSRCGWTMFNFRAGLIRALQSAGHEVIAAGSVDAYADRVRSLGAEFVPLPISFNPVNPIGDAQLVGAMFRFLRRVRPAVVHNFTIKPVVMGSFAAHLAGTPRIINTVTGLGYAFTGNRTLLRGAVETLYRRALRHSDHTFFQNRNDHDYFVTRKLLTHTASVVMGSGVDLEHFAAANVPSTGEGVRFLMVSRLLRDKGVLDYFDAARALKMKYGRDVVFEILGPIDHRNPTAVSEQTVREWETEGVGRWLGHSDDVRPHLRGTHVVVLPSHGGEGIPRALIEAAAVGRAAVATQVPGCTDAIAPGLTGFLVPARRTSELAAAMERFVRDPSLVEQMGLAARYRAEQLFSERMVIQAAMDRYFAAQ